MIGFLRGRLTAKHPPQLLVDVGGVGYGLLVTNEDHGRLQSGQKAKLYIYEQIRENAHDLFGFLALDTKRLFEQLLSVNGVGPKMALIDLISSYSCSAFFQSSA